MTPQTFSNRIGMALLGLTFLCLAACGGAQARKAKHLARGDAYMAASNYQKARIEFQNALQIDPADPTARYDNGLVSEKLGRHREAARFYESVIDVKPDHVEARASLARLYLISGNPDKALELIAPVIANNPDNAELLTIRASCEFQQKKTSEALADAERAVQLKPTNEDSIAVLAGLYESNGEKDKARALLEKSVKAVPESVDLRLILVRSYARDNDKEAMEAQLLELTRLQPTERAHRIRLAQFYAGTGQLDAAERTLRQAIKDLSTDGEIKLSLVEFLSAHRGAESAEKELVAMLAADPKNTDLEFALGKFYESTHHPEKAESVYRRVIDAEGLDDAGLQARDKLAALQAERGDSAGAVALANEVLKKSPRDDDALFLRGNIALSHKDPKAAIADLRAVLRDHPNSPGVLRALALAHLANGEPAIAEETLRNAADSNPKDPLLHLEFARLLVDTGKAEQAKPVLADLIKAHPDYAEAVDLRFRVSLATKDYATAESDAKALVAMRPKSAVPYLYQGQVAEAQGRTDEAIGLYAKAVETQPDALEPLQDETRLLVRGGRTAEAMKRLDDFSARYPANPLGPDAKGEILLHAGKTAEATEAFKTAIARSPKWWVSYRDLAAAQIANQKTDEAIATLQNAKTSVDDPDAIRFELAGLLQRMGKLDASIAEYTEVLDHNPRSDAAANNLAMLLAGKGDRPSLDRAQALSARFADSANPSFLDTYGWVLYKRGDAAAAVPVFERVVAKVTDDPVAHYHLGMAQAQAGITAGARNNLTLAISAGRKFNGFDDAKATLDKLGSDKLAQGSSPQS
jgi:tetratricopeptide (TPR) repeat protein